MVDKIKVEAHNNYYLVLNLTKLNKLKKKYKKYLSNKKAKRLAFQQSHTHIKNKDIAYTIRNNVINKKLPKTNDYYLLYSHIRLSTDNEYIKKVKGKLDECRGDRIEFERHDKKGGEWFGKYKKEDTG